ncbi:MAG: heme-binding protein [Pseudolabrys sp.]|nr:heme-binding protein [Pseudolabrys sp.]MSP32881.1 heme-binding protein [Pseudolabrys sp.]
MSVTLAQASTIVDTALKKARELKQMPQTVVVLDAGGHVVAAKREDGSGILRYEISIAKAYGALGMGWGSRTMMERAAQNPNFLTAIVGASGGRLIPNPAGILIRDAGNAIIGAVGISGDTGDNDEIIGIAGIEAVGLKADPGGSKK